MNTAISHSPLETLLLFRGIARHGLDAPAFARISDTLQHNGLVTNSSTYDAARLRPESLQELFLNLLWEELKSESDNSVRPDGELSPASKKRKLQPPPPPTLKDARHHLAKIESIYVKLQDEYIRQTIKEIRHFEKRYDQLQSEIGLLEEANRQAVVNQAPRSKSPNGVVQDSAADRDSGKVNGTIPPSRPSSKTPLQTSPPVPPPIPQQTLPPVSPQPLPEATRWQATVNGPLPPSDVPLRVPVSTPSPVSAMTPVTLPNPVAVAPSTSALAQGIPPAPPPLLAPAPTPKPASLASVSAPNLNPGLTAPVPPPAPQNQSQTDFSLRRQPSQPTVGIEKQTPQDNTPSFASSPRPQPTKPQEIPKAPNGGSQVLQPPRGIPPFQAPPQQFTPPPVVDGLQRPDNIPRPKQSPVPLPPNSQQDAQAQLKWEPFYQPGNSPIHQAPGPHSQLPTQHSTQPIIQPPQLPQPVQSQRLPQPTQHAVHHGARPLQPHTSKPLQHQVLTPPQNVGNHHYQQPQHLPPQHLAPIRPAPESHTYQKPPWPPFSHPTQARVNPPQHPSSYHGYSPTGVRSPVAHSPTPSPTGSHPRPSQLAPPQPQQQTQPTSQPQVAQPLQAPSPFNQRDASSGPPSPAPPQGDPQRGYNSPYQQPPRAAIPDRVQSYRPSVATTPATLTARFALSAAPHTPILSSLPRQLITGSGTKWSKTSTPSTPKNAPELRLDETASPAHEPLSPVLQKSLLPSVVPQGEIKNEPPASAAAPLPPVETPTAKRKSGRPRGSQKAHDAASPPRSVAPEELPSQEQKSPAKELPKLTVEPEQMKIKDEVTTPNPATEAGDTTADESVAGRLQSKRRTKRKRDDLSPTPAQTPVESQVPIIPDASALEPNTVIWTRSFHKVSASAMEQIVRHRLANMFAAPIREKDAPGYHKLILQPQDLKSIKAAIMTGNRAAAQAAAALPGGDPGTSSVRLPTSEELMPPKAIINSSQLDRELAHMFSNAIMYNPDHGHGPGPAFMVREDEENQVEDGEGEDHGGGAAHQSGHQQEHILGYKVDEYGVVHDTRAMFQDVDKWLSELRSAEIERGYKPPATGTSTRQASVAGGGLQGEHSFSSNTATTATAASGLWGGDTTMDDGDEQTGTEPETAVKRRRTTRGV